MADVNKTIKSAGGDYATAALWEAAIPSDQAVTDPWIGSAEEAFDIGVVTINVSNANAAPHRLTVGASFRFIEGANWTKAGAGTDLDSMLADTDFARIEATASTGITISTPSIIIEHLWLECSSGTSSHRALQAAAVDATVRYCTVARTGSNGIFVYATSAGDTFKLHDCVLFSTGAGANFIRIDGDNARLGHFTAIGNGSKPREIDVAGGGTGNDVDNSIVFDTEFTRFCVSTTEWTGDFNLSDGSGSTGAPGGNSTNSLTPSDVIESVAANIDPRMTQLAAATYQGTDHSATFGSVDIEGVTRTNFIIGAFEVVPLTTHTAAVATIGGGGLAAATATFAPDTSTGSVASIAGGGLAAATATHTPPVFTASVAAIAGGGVAAATATHTPPVFTGAVATIAGGGLAAAAATHTAPVFTGSTATIGGGGLAAATATHTAPVFTASVAAISGGGVSTVTATHVAPVFTGSVATIAGGGVAAASATHVAPGFTGAVAAIAGGGVASASATFVPTFTASVASISGGGLAAATATHVAPTFAATAATISGGGASAVTATFAVRAAADQDVRLDVVTGTMLETTGGARLEEGATTRIETTGGFRFEQGATVRLEPKRKQ